MQKNNRCRELRDSQTNQPTNKIKKVWIHAEQKSWKEPQKLVLKINIYSVFHHLQSINRLFSAVTLCTNVPPLKKNKTISTRNHAEVKEVQFELISTLKLTAREQLPRRHSATPSHQTENGTVNRHYKYIHRCKELSHRCSRPCHRVHSLQVMPQGSQKKNSLGHHLGYWWQCKKCTQQKVSVQICTFRPWNTEWNRHQRATESH